MGDRMHFCVIFSPWFDLFAERRRKIREFNRSSPTMLADQPRINDVPAEDRQERRAAAFRERKRRRKGCETLTPDVAVMAYLCSRPVRADQGMGHPPNTAGELSKRLRHPAR